MTESEVRDHAPPVREADRRRRGRRGLRRQLPLSGARRRAAEDAEDHPVEPLRPGIRQVVRRHLHQGVGRRRTTRTSSSITSRSARSTRGPPRRSRRRRVTTCSCSSRRRPRTRSRSSTTGRSTRRSRRSTARRSSWRSSPPSTRRRRSTSRSRTPTSPDPGNYRKDLWEKVGFPNGPDTWDDLRVGRQEDQGPVRQSRSGVGLSQELDTNMAMRALLWSFGGAEQDRGRQRHHQLEADGRGHQVHAGALQGGDDARGLHLGPVVEQPRHPRRASSPSWTTRSRSRARPRRTTPTCPPRSS